MKENPGTRKYAIGVRLDDIKSWGALLYFNTDKFLKSLKLLSGGRYGVEYWTTLEAYVHDGVKNFQPYPAVGDLFVGEYCILDMSRNDVFDQKVYIGGKEILPEKGSGILVVVGAGSGDGSWYDNVYQSYFGKPCEFRKDDELAYVVIKENKARPIAILQKGQTLVFDSYNDARGIVAPDSHEDHSVKYEIGSQAEIWISDLKLPVVRVR